MVDERIIERIKKCLALAGSDNEHEAQSAALQAQKLMAQYGVAMADIEDEFSKDAREVIKIEQAEVGPGLAWKFQLAGIIAQNFKCKTFSYGKTVMAFYGHETDSAIAKEVFMFLLKMGHKLGLKARAKVRKEAGQGDGVYNSFVLGFMAGIREKLEAQSTALMIIVPQDVKTDFEEFIKGAKSNNTKSLKDENFNYEAYANGKTEGRQAMGNRELESK